MNIFIHTFSPSSISYYKEGRKEYEKRLSRYSKIKYIPYKSEKQLTKAIDKMQSTFDHSEKDRFIIVTAGTKKSTIDSPALASFIESSGVAGISNLHFLVGFPINGIPCKEKDLFFLSISNMTIPADLLSLILEEQIYRAYRIINKEPYHK